MLRLVALVRTKIQEPHSVTSQKTILQVTQSYNCHLTISVLSMQREIRNVGMYGAQLNKDVAWV
jgi:hypothetical protein